MQRSAIIAGDDLGLGATGGVERWVGGNRDEGVERGIESLKPVKAFVRELDGRKAASADLFGGVDKREHAPTLYRSGELAAVAGAVGSEP